MKNILKRNRQELILLLIILAVGGIIGGIFLLRPEPVGYSKQHCD